MVERPPFYPESHQLHYNQQERRDVDLGRVEAIEADLDRFIERRARGSKDGRSRANEEAERWRERDARYRASLRLVHAKAWAEYFGGLALASHDAAARYAEKRDEALALVRELEDSHRKERKSA